MVLHGHLKALVLKLLSKKDMSGYDLMKSIGEHIGKKPSPGSMYPLLDSLIKDGFASVKQVKRRKVYKITSEGRQELKTVFKECNEISSRLHAFTQKVLPGENYEGFMLKYSSEIMDVYEIPEIIEMKRLFVDLMKKGIIKKKKEEVASIIRDVNKKLRGLE